MDEKCPEMMKLEKLWATIACLAVGALSGAGIYEMWRGNDIGIHGAMGSAIGAIIAPLALYATWRRD